ncbi:glycosyltransferase family 2 protein [Arthrobacter sp. B3I4]|uniref:glycosyltransferase n=1 Tax=Arthrobacter sp. B3I4 TaxID=3042267 RepID=UPI00277D7741|nr:glycosyltransferase [Arthrobacter sp. B3I4]MDQ0754487.1 glycosyltransferase involved in cell wall biosynthesis [Arthrobacter sp. B3I4]
MSGLAAPAPGPQRHTGIDTVAVVLPAHNEDQHIDSALRAVRRAADELQRMRPEVVVRVMVVLDSCNDRSAQITAGYVDADPRFGSLDVRLRSAGASRAAGVRAALFGRPRRAPGLRPGPAPWPGRTWLANTDADSQVPVNWLVRQLEFAEAGADAVLGSVEPDPAGMDPELLRRWLERHPFEEDHPHIYGANFGVRASAYLAAGGFSKQVSHEDRILVQGLRGLAFAVLATDSMRVLTSGRTHARAPQGFGTYLRALGRQRPPTVASN